MPILSLVFACILPHGGECLPEFAGENPERAARTRAAMAEVGRRLEEKKPDVVVVATPHGIAVPGGFCLPLGEVAAGEMSEGEATVGAGFVLDTRLGWDIGRRAAGAQVPVVPVYFPPGSPVPLDWGALIPLYYAGRSYSHRPEVVVFTPTPEGPLEQQVEMGRALAEAAVASKKRVAFIASADQGHCHDPEGPYGFDEMSARWDRFFCEAVEAQDLGRLLAADPDMVERGKPDSLWQALILHGVLQKVPMNGELLSYEVPTYFGMACAAYEPAG
ncbi:MAG: extradiol ring-cleavage dioxygenase [Bacillota bacterium]